MLILGQDPVPDRDGLVEGVGGFGLLGGFDEEQAGVEAVGIDVAAAVVGSAVQGDLVQQRSQRRIGVAGIAARHR